MSFHDPATGDKHTIDVGLEGRTFKRHSDQYVIEQRGEDLRLAYVALTRAKHQAVIWWAGSGTAATRRSRGCCSQGRGRRMSGRSATRPRPTRPSSSDFASWPRRRPGGSASSARRSGCRLRGARRSTPPAELEAARFDRRLDLWWRRTSYSDITAEAHDPLVASEPERPVLSDEPETPTPVAVGGVVARPELERESPLGTAAGRGRLRDLRAPRARGDRLRRPRPRRRARRRVAGAQSRRALDLGDPGSGRRRVCARRSRRRSGRWSAGSGCATSPARTGSTSSSSSCRWPAATRPPAG